MIAFGGTEASQLHHPTYQMAWQLLISHNRALSTNRNPAFVSSLGPVHLTSQDQTALQHSRIKHLGAQSHTHATLQHSRMAHLGAHSHTHIALWNSRMGCLGVLSHSQAQPVWANTHRARIRTARLRLDIQGAQRRVLLLTGNQDLIWFQLLVS